MSVIVRHIAAFIFCCIWLIAGCGKATADDLPKKELAAITAADCALLDRLVTLKTVFPNPAVRRLFRKLPPSTQEGQRGYTFQLKRQPGMNSNRHFYIITIVWTRDGQSENRSGSTVGPNGGLIDAFEKTEDRAWDIRVALGSLLPNRVEDPDFDVHKTAIAMARLYNLSHPLNK